MLRIFPVEVADLAELQLKGLGHPIFGPLFELGTYMSVSGIPSDAAAVDYLLGTEFEEFSTKLGFQIAHDDCRARILGERITVPAMSATLDSKLVHDSLSDEEPISILFTEPSSSINPLCLFVSPAATNSGAKASCVRSDLWETWYALVGFSAGVGHDLLGNDQVGSVESEERLMKRLLQLYGGI